MCQIKDSSNSDHCVIMFEASYKKKYDDPTRTLNFKKSKLQKVALPNVSY